MNNKKLYKHNKKLIKLLKKDGFRQPFQLLLDESFILKVNQYKKRYKHLVELFKHEPKLFVTKCGLTNYKKNNKKCDDDKKLDNDKKGDNDKKLDNDKKFDIDKKCDNNKKLDNDKKGDNDKKFDIDISDNCKVIDCKHSEKIENCYKKFFSKGNKHNYILLTSSRDVLEEFKNIPVLRFSKGMFKIHMETSHIERYKGFPKEATQEELERLKRIFEEEINTDEDQLKHDEVDFDELEESSDDDSKDGDSSGE